MHSVEGISSRVRAVGPSLVRVIAMALIAAVGLSALHAEGAAPAERNRGFFYAFPAYLYGDRSNLSAQLGYQFEKFQLRLDASQIIDSDGDRISMIATPSLGAFFCQEWQPGIRTYQGVVLGGEVGLVNSFKGLGVFVGFRAGAEWAFSARRSFFLEIGPGFGLVDRDGAYNGGTVIGGGLKISF
jgi:hypothetical protein